jgi:hypothetical protein
MILSGTFNQLTALFAVLILLYYIAAFLAVLFCGAGCRMLPGPTELSAIPSLGAVARYPRLNGQAVVLSP